MNDIDACLDARRIVESDPALLGVSAHLLTPRRHLCHHAGVAYDEGLATRVRELIGGELGITEKKMFGGLAMMLNGNMAVGVHGDGLIVRADPGEQEALLAEPGARIFDMTGRPMKGWLVVDTEGCAEDDDLRRWGGGESPTRKACRPSDSRPDDHFAVNVALLEPADRLGGLSERIDAVDRGRDLAGLDEFREGVEILCVRPPRGPPVSRWCDRHPEPPQAPPAID
ncbi:MAG TPA: TfoX/Sxy family protein [Candidatus Limnocylindrales bacterium]|nr:TfoX/Sxy family protein [Candidatus Limnocylindrales bacterium]